MLREVERFIAEEPNGSRHTVSCFQEFGKADRQSGSAIAPGSKHFRTTNGVFLKAVNEFTFNILGSGKMLYKQER